MALAEVLDEPPPWLALPGQQWPLFAAAEKMAPVSAAAKRAAATISAVGAEPLSERRARHRGLFRSKGRPQLWLHESLYRSGRLLGPQMVEVAQLYRVAGLQIAAGELPDHASVELAFLAHLARQATMEPGHAGQWRRTEKLFLRKHAARWLPKLGRALAASGDEVYAPVGMLLADWLQEPVQRQGRKRPVRRLPVVRQAQCTLCGFCVQRCPTGALMIDEDDEETALLLSADRCCACGKCVQVCETQAMQMKRAPQGQKSELPLGWQPLRRSPRARCPACGEPTISDAELDFVARQIGRPQWLAYCLRCRAH
jgi:nitrate reductase assembly molybdenum cofactor insertion protein NarJ